MKDRVTLLAALRPSRRATILVLAAATGLVWQQTSGADAAAETVVDAAEVEGIIFERQQVMLQLEEDADTLGSIVAGEVPPERMAETARAIAQGARDSIAAFQAKVPGGRSKPEVWSNWADYSERMENFARSAEEMAKLAEGGSVSAVSSMLGDALPCKQCHDVYRAPKKKKQ